MDLARGAAPVPAFRIALGLCAIAVVGASAVVHAQAGNPDGVSYFEIAEAYLAGRWSEAVNSYWSPLYSWLLAIPLALVRPSPERELPLAHLLNIVIFAGAAIALDYYLTGLLRAAPARWAESRLRPVVHALWVTAFVMLAWVGLAVIDIASVTPDWCVAALFLVTMGLLLRWVDSPPSRRQRALLGVLLALGYLAKAAMLPLALVILAGTIAMEWWRGRRGRDLLIPAIAFAIAAAPWVAALSVKKGHLTTGDTGRIAYIKLVSGPGGPTLTYGKRALDAPLPAYAFPHPAAGTYPPMRDPAYGEDALRPRFHAETQLALLRDSVRMYADFARGNLVGVIVAILLLAVAATRRSSGETRGFPWAPTLLVVVPSAAAAAMYALVHINWRYVGPFLLASALAILVALVAAGERTRLTLPALALAIGSLLLQVAVEVRHDVRIVRAGPAAAGWPLHVARQLQLQHGQGLAPGTAVAVMGSGATFAPWARLARLCIVAEVPAGGVAAFVDADPGAQQAVLDALAGAGSQAVVAEFKEGRRPDATWRPVAGTSLHYRPLEASYALAPGATLADSSAAAGRRVGSHTAWCRPRSASSHAAIPARLDASR